MQLSNKALGIFISVVILIVSLIAFFVLKPDSDPHSAEVVKEEQKQKNESKEKDSKDFEQKEPEDKSSENSTSIEKEPADKESSEDKADKVESEDKSTSNEKVEDEIAKRVAAEVENQKKTIKRLDEQLEVISTDYVEKLTKIFEKTEKEYLKLKETSKGDSKVLNKFFEKKSLEIGNLYKEANAKISDSEWKNAASNYKDFDKWREPFVKTFEDGMKSFQELHTKTSKELIDESKEKAEEKKSEEKKKAEEKKQAEEKKKAEEKESTSESNE